MKPEQAHFGRLYVRMFFRKASPQTEGRRDADLLINEDVTGCTDLKSVGRTPYHPDTAGGENCTVGVQIEAMHKLRFFYAP